MARRTALVVSRDGRSAAKLCARIRNIGHDALFVPTYATAKALLQTGIDLLITDVKLGDYNGVHLALRAQSLDVPTIVVGPKDAVLQRDAVSVGATYVAGQLEQELLEERLSPLADDPADPSAEQPCAPMQTVAVPSPADMLWRFFVQSPTLVDHFGRRLLLN